MKTGTLGTHAQVIPLTSHLKMPFLIMIAFLWYIDQLVSLVRKWVEDEPERLKMAMTMAEEKRKEAQDRPEAAESHQRRNVSEETRVLEARKNGQQMQQFLQQLQQHQRQQQEINSGKLTQHQQLQDVRLQLISRGLSQEQAALVLTRFMPHHTSVPAPHPAPQPAPHPAPHPATLHNTVSHTGTIAHTAPHPAMPASMNGNCQGSI